MKELNLLEIMNKDGLLSPSIIITLSSYYIIILLYSIVYKHYSRLYLVYRSIIEHNIILYRYKYNKEHRGLSSDNIYYVTQ